MAKTKDVNLADTWLNGQSTVNATDQISDTFVIVTDHTKRQKTDTPGSSPPSINIHTSNSEGDNSPGNSSPTSHHKQINDAAANLFVSVGSFYSNAERTGPHTDIFGSNPTFTFKTRDSEVEAFQMLTRFNPHENGLCRSPRLL